MKTKDSIKEKGRTLFNQFGVKNVTLREVAKQIGKSYGNITYHFATKEKLITELFYDMNMELSQLQTIYSSEDSLMKFFLMLPEYSFNITIKYLFFSKDYVELKRTYTDFFKTVKSLNEARQSSWLKLLIKLQEEGYLVSELSVKDLEYIMELSVGIRMFYFQNNEWDEFDKSIYIRKVNKLLYPYLSANGLEVYNEFSFRT